MTMNGSRTGALLTPDHRSGNNGSPARAGKWLWRRGDTQLWQDYAKDGSGLGRADIRYFVGRPGSAVTSFDVLHDACIHFCKVTHGK